MYGSPLLLGLAGTETSGGFALNSPVLRSRSGRFSILSPSDPPSEAITPNRIPLEARVKTLTRSRSVSESTSRRGSTRVGTRRFATPAGSISAEVSDGWYATGTPAPSTNDVTPNRTASACAERWPALFAESVDAPPLQPVEACRAPPPNTWGSLRAGGVV